MKYGPFFLDLFQHRILAGEGEQDLTVTEFKLLRILIEAKGRIITREKLMRDVWDIDDETQTRTVKLSGEWDIIWPVFNDKDNSGPT